MRRYSEEKKAAVISALLAGQSVNAVAEEYKIPKSTVSRWKNSDIGTNGTQKKEIGELLLDYLQENLATLRAQATFFRDEKWLARQSAESAAVLHGVMTDKAVRLLEAMSKANVPASGAPAS